MELLIRFASIKGNTSQLKCACSISGGKKQHEVARDFPNWLYLVTNTSSYPKQTIGCIGQEWKFSTEKFYPMEENFVS